MLRRPSHTVSVPLRQRQDMCLAAWQSYLVNLDRTFVIFAQLYKLAIRQAKYTVCTRTIYALSYSLNPQDRAWVV